MGCLNCFKAKGEKGPAKISTAQTQPTWSLPTIDTPTCLRTYKDGCCWRSFTLKSVKIFQPKGEEAIRNILPIWSKKFCVKCGPAVQLFEAAALRYVAENSSIPVPKVYCAFQNERITYILMDFVEGEEIGKNRANRREEEKQSLLEQLEGIYEELHNIPHPYPGVLAAADMQALYDPRFFGRGIWYFGPFANEAEFNNFLRCGMQVDSPWLDSGDSLVTNEEKAEMRELIAFHVLNPHKICFTQGDASSSNIMVKDGKVVALIDFELSGFYPEYWEYTTVMNVNKNDGF